MMVRELTWTSGHLDMKKNKRKDGGIEALIDGVVARGLVRKARRISRVLALLAC